MWYWRWYKFYSKVHLERRYMRIAFGVCSRRRAHCVSFWSFPAKRVNVFSTQITIISGVHLISQLFSNNITPPVQSRLLRCSRTSREQGLKYNQIQRERHTQKNSCHRIKIPNTNKFSGGAYQKIQQNWTHTHTYKIDIVSFCGLRSATLFPEA
jgi:hypothetical protein